MEFNGHGFKSYSGQLSIATSEILNLVKQFTLHSAEEYSEPLPTSKQRGYLIGGNYFHKNSILDFWKGSEYVFA